VLKNPLSVAALAVMLMACQPTPNNSKHTHARPIDGVVFVSQNAEKAGQVTIPYKKYQLDNGLSIVLHEDHSDPLVHVDVSYHVGSAREEQGKSGFAHFFEHMMFQGSKNVADEEHIKIITEAGGSMNGTTNADRTNYYQSVPANQLEKMLWLEADRMGFLLDSVTQEKFEVQRETVKNERGQNYDNQPYGLRSERNSEALYPPGHPYSWSTIGYIDDLNRVDVNDLKAFFVRWYGPNNAVLTIGGDIDPVQVLLWVKKYFGSIPMGAEVRNAAKKPVELTQTRYLTLEDEVHLPLLQVTYPSVYVNHEDEAPLDVLSNVLGGGKTSLFYKNLVKTGDAVQALVSHPCQELACEFQLIALANPAKTPKLGDILQRFDQTLAEFEQRGVNADDLNRTKAGIESSTIFALQSVSGKVSTLASNQLFDNNPDLVQENLDRYNAVTAGDVMRVYRRYIKGKPKVVLSIVPKGQTELAAKSANFTAPKRDVVSNESKVLAIASPGIKDTFDRSVQPMAGPTPQVVMPAFWQTNYANGLALISHKTTETPTVTLSFSMEGGPLLDPIDKAGLASMTAQMMNESTRQLSNEEMANQLALLGSSIRFSANGRYSNLSVSMLTKNMDKTLALVKQKLFSPAFLAADFTGLQQRLGQSLQQEVKNPSVLASRGVSKLLFGEHNRVSLPDEGTLQSMQNITLNDVKGFYQRYYSPSKGNLVVVGNVDKKIVEKKLEFLSQWQGPDYQIPPYGDFPEAQKRAIYLIDQPGAAQSVVRIIKPGLPYDATGKQFKSKLMNFALGGMFNSRINLNLREDKGYTYGASSRFIGGKTLGWFEASADLKQVNTADGLREFFKEIEVYQQQGMTQEELKLMRNAYTQSDALDYETPNSKARFLRHLLTYNLDKNYREEQNTIINNIGRDELNKLAAEALDLTTMQVVVVGDAKLISEQLKGLGWDIIPLQVPY
jgi:zinc protease